ncbi:unnamed protein product [Hydatigera taeniaeformis]|uniref:Uncharacterized protein n=1 Tax=Hydatigena taeniaeformis TaxID=6205 RepID=A0A3P7HJV7_HYDTA|nr:unnamed protein product [Hydatigera taeniaeformis]
MEVGFTLLHNEQAHAVPNASRGAATDGLHASHARAHSQCYVRSGFTERYEHGISDKPTPTPCETVSVEEEWWNDFHLSHVGSIMRNHYLKPHARDIRHWFFLVAFLQICAASSETASVTFDYNVASTAPCIVGDLGAERGWVILPDELPEHFQWRQSGPYGVELEWDVEKLSTDFASSIKLRFEPATGGRVYEREGRFASGNIFIRNLSADKQYNAFLYAKRDGSDEEIYKGVIYTSSASVSSKTEEVSGLVATTSRCALTSALSAFLLTCTMAVLV